MGTSIIQPGFMPMIANAESLVASAGNIAAQNSGAVMAELISGNANNNSQFVQTSIPSASATSGLVAKSDDPIANIFANLPQIQDKVNEQIIADGLRAAGTGRQMFGEVNMQESSLHYFVMRVKINETGRFLSAGVFCSRCGGGFANYVDGDDAEGTYFDVLYVRDQIQTDSGLLHSFNVPVGIDHLSDKITDQAEASIDRWFAKHAEKRNEFFTLAPYFRAFFVTPHHPAGARELASAARGQAGEIASDPMWSGFFNNALEVLNIGDSPKPLSHSSVLYNDMILADGTTKNIKAGMPIFVAGHLFVLLEEDMVTKNDSKVDLHRTRHLAHVDPEGRVEVITMGPDDEIKVGGASAKDNDIVLGPRRHYFKFYRSSISVYLWLYPNDGDDHHKEYLPIIVLASKYFDAPSEARLARLEAAIDVSSDPAERMRIENLKKFLSPPELAMVARDQSPLSVPARNSVASDGYLSVPRGGTKFEPIALPVHRRYERFSVRDVDDFNIMARRLEDHEREKVFLQIGNHFGDYSLIVEGESRAILERNGRFFSVSKDERIKLVDGDSVFYDTKGGVRQILFTVRM